MSHARASLLLVLALGACSPPAEPPPVETPAPPAAPGPDGMPDREQDPVAFYTWRIDRLFLDVDKDKDGMVSRSEFTGNPDEFPVMDTDKDDHITKSEMSKYVMARYVVVLPESPNP